ncbi:MAG: hydantoinase/oxoprolinase family protein, partial [Thaumarchaeota archaeon]|nr:hydantoinase/oxoprolinase family protein [Nitrososphaerota archaeon]
MLRLAVDIGGTFTDAVILDEENHAVLQSKVPSTPRDYSQGVLTSIRQLVAGMREIESFIHGTTVGTNAVIQGTFPNAGLLTTKGFKDILEIGRGNRVDMYDPFYRMPEPPIPRDRRLEIEERMDHNGVEISSINLEHAEKTIQELVDLGARSIAICLINSYANDAHEEKIRSLIKKLYPDVLVSTSTEITREYNEYERTSTVVINALLLNLMSTYLGALEKEIISRGFPGRLILIQSNGGLMTSNLARKVPVHTINSGLVGGILAVRKLGVLLGIPNLIGADMGGTSFDVELVIDGKYETTPILRITTPKSGPDGYPILIPAVDIHAIGTGGGSIAWADSAGSLHVGPMSAAADPGPACYGKGGEQPTVTDANLVLGRLNSARFLGGEMKVYPELARKALKKLGDQFSMEILEIAEGILRIAVPNMASAIRTMTIERGIDPREFTMVSFGGAGPLHANLIAKELDIRTIIVSTMPGNFSAWGMLMADFRRDYVQTFVQSLTRIDAMDLEHRFAKMESDAL